MFGSDVLSFWSVIISSDNTLLLLHRPVNLPKASPQHPPKLKNMVFSKTVSLFKISLFFFCGEMQRAVQRSYVTPKTRCKRPSIACSRRTDFLKNYQENFQIALSRLNVLKPSCTKSNVHLQGMLWSFNRCFFAWFETCVCEGEHVCVLHSGKFFFSGRGEN